MSDFFEIIPNKDLRQQSNWSFWPIDEFKKAYPDGSAGYTVIAAGDDPPSSDSVATLVIRTFIENGERLKSDQKYIIGIRFYGFGELATVDIIGLDLPNHRDIVMEHMKRLDWPLLSGQESKDKFGDSYSVPFMFVGGHSRIKDGKIYFSGSSDDYGQNILLADANKIAAYAASSCDINQPELSDEEGQIFTKELLEFMLSNKRKKDFYELLVSHILNSAKKNKRQIDREFTGQGFGGLLMMKACDRQINEGGNILEILTNEITEGFSRYILLAKTTNLIHLQKEENS